MLPDMSSSELLDVLCIPYVYSLLYNPLRSSRFVENSRPKMSVCNCIVDFLVLNMSTLREDHIGWRLELAMGLLSWNPTTKSSQPCPMQLTRLHGANLDVLGIPVF